jgi:hypothetical protein
VKINIHDRDAESIVLANVTSFETTRFYTTKLDYLLRIIDLSNNLNI